MIIFTATKDDVPILVIRVERIDNPDLSEHERHQAEYGRYLIEARLSQPEAVSAGRWMLAGFPRRKKNILGLLASVFHVMPSSAFDLEQQPPETTDSVQRLRQLIEKLLEEDNNDS